MSSNEDLRSVVEKAWALAEIDNLDGIMFLAEYYEKEEKDLEKVVSLLQRAAELGCSDAMMKLFLYYENGNVVEKDYDMCYKLASTAFENGDVPQRANFALGRCYLEGFGTQIDPLKALKHFAMAMNECSGMGGLFEVFYDRARKKLDETTYVKWLQDIHGEIAYCQYKLGEMFENGEYFTENVTQAKQLYRMSSSNGCLDGKMGLAILLKDSNDKEDQSEAEQIFKDVISSKYTYEHQRAKRCLGSLYENSGRIDEAIEILEDLFNTYNDDIACGLLASIYFERKEYDKSRCWCQRAYDISGSEKAKNLLDAIDEMIRTGAADSSKSSGGCYVATAVYGSYDCPQVWTLRRFRDNTLDSSRCGRLFIRLYYAISPTVVKYFGGTKSFKRIFKKRLDKMVDKLNAEGVENTPYDDKEF